MYPSSLRNLKMDLATSVSDAMSRNVFVPWTLSSSSLTVLQRKSHCMLSSVQDSVCFPNNATARLNERFVSPEVLATHVYISGATVKIFARFVGIVRLIDADSFPQSCRNVDNSVFLVSQRLHSVLCPYQERSCLAHRKANQVEHVAQYVFESI